MVTTPNSDSLSASGTITAHVHWGGTGSPPAQVIQEEDCAVSWSGGAGTMGGCANLLGGSTVAASPGPGGSCVYTKYTVMAPPSGDFDVSTGPTADVTVPHYVGGAIGVVYRVVFYNPAVQLSGTTVDTSGHEHILVGQGCTSSLAGIPPTLTGLPVGTGGTTFAWSWIISGNTFQTWQPTTPAIGTAPANPNASYYVAGPGPVDQPTAHWYWNEDAAPETVTCHLTVTPPAAYGNSYSVSASKQVSVVVPDFTASGKGGYMQVNQYAPNDSNYELWAGPTAGEKTDGQNFGMNWQLTVTTPTTPTFGLGSLELVQITTPNDSYKTDTTPQLTSNNSQNGLTGLDTTYPYASGGESSVALTSGDSPGIQLVAPTYQAASATYTASFSDYLMYLPPGTDHMWVPLAKFAWSTNGSADLPQPQDSWASYSMVHGGDAAGTVSYNSAPYNGHPNGDPITDNSPADFASTHDFPSWTRIDSKDKR